jgi:membrane protein
MDVREAWRHVEDGVDRARSSSALLDHTMAMLEHYGRVNGGGQAGAVTYYAFLAFFPIMALSFAAVGLIANVFPDAQENLVTLVNSLLEGLIGDGPGQVPLSAFQDNAGKVGLLGLLGFLYAGLGWMSSMRNALQMMFEKAPDERPNFFYGKARDLTTLAIVGLMLLFAFGLTSAVSSYSDEIVEGLGFDPDAAIPTLALQVGGALLALLVTSSLLMLLYHFLARPRVAYRALREGALLAAGGFVVLKLIADRLIALTHGQPAFTVFGFSLVLLVLINYFSRVVMYGAAWAFTSQRPVDLNVGEVLVGPHDRSQRGGR